MLTLGFAIEILTLALALGGLLLQTRRDPGSPPSWRNLSNGGRMIFSLLVVIAAAKTIKNQIDSTAAQNEGIVRAAEMAELKATNSHLLQTNQHLIKVMSVASGYSALLSGVVVFEQVPDKARVEDALRNLFLKYAEVEISAVNTLGKYQGRIDYGAHPEVRRYLNLQHIQEDSLLVRLQSLVPQQQWPGAFFFEIRCASLKILNQEKIQYARFDPGERLQVTARVFDWWQDFRSLYGVRKLYLDKITIEELGETHLARTF